MVEKVHSDENPGESPLTLQTLYVVQEGSNSLNDGECMLSDLFLRRSSHLNLESFFFFFFQLGDHKTRKSDRKQQNQLSTELADY